MEMDIFKGSRIISLDIETTGVNMEYDRIIELGVVEYVDGVCIMEHERLFGGGRSPPYLVKSVHGITDRQRAGMETFEDCAERIAAYLSGATLVGHNLKRFDVPFIIAKLASTPHRLENYKMIDTLLHARKLKLASHTLESLAKFFNLEYGGHRGLGDAKTSFELLKVLIGSFKARKLEELWV